MASIDDELDALMGTFPATAASPRSAGTPQPKQATVDEFDAFMADFEATPSTQRAVAVTKPQIKRKGKYTVSGAAQGQELNALLDNLEAKVSDVKTNDGSKGVCVFCNQPILADMMTVQGKNYHPEHVFCSVCNKRQSDRKYFETDGLILCPSCHGNRTGMTCAACGQPILDKVVNAMNKHWHPHHFVCTQCKTNFPTGKYCELEGKPYCEPCFRTVGIICKLCKKSITSGGVSAMGGNFHKECFGCATCKKPFGPGFYEHEGLPYCERHFLEKKGIPYCGGCNQPIQGRFISALNQKWHQEHFTCAFCTKPLSPDFRVHNSQPYCPACYGSII